MNKLPVLAYSVLYILWIFRSDHVDDFQLLIGFGFLVVVNLLESLIKTRE